MSDWQPIETAPKDGTPFVALNHDLEIWAARYDDIGRISYRQNYRYEPRSFTIVNHYGEELMREDKEFADKNECWRNDWVFWSRLYDFSPTHWMPLPAPPAKQKQEAA